MLFGILYLYFRRIANYYNYLIKPYFWGATGARYVFRTNCKHKRAGRHCPSRWFLHLSLALYFDHHQSQIIQKERRVKQCTRGRVKILALWLVWSPYRNIHPIVIAASWRAAQYFVLYQWHHTEPVCDMGFGWLGGGCIHWVHLWISRFLVTKCHCSYEGGCSIT